MSKNLKLLVFAGAAMIVLGFAALVIFSDSDENANSPVVAQTPQPALVVLPPVVTPLPGDLPTPSIDGTVTPLSPQTTSPESKKPMEQPKPSGTPGQVVSYEIQSGDMVSKIASKYGCKRKDIYDINEGLNDQTATRLRVGQKIKVPDMRGIGGNTKDGGETANVSKTSTSESTPTVSTPTPPQAPDPPALAGSCTHKLQKGDTLFTLATHYYGSPKHFQLIRKANPDCDWIKLETGREIVIPALNGAVKATVSNESNSKSHNPIPARN